MGSSDDKFSVGRGVAIVRSLRLEIARIDRWIETGEYVEKGIDINYLKCVRSGYAGLISDAIRVYRI